LIYHHQHPVHVELCVTHSRTGARGARAAAVRHQATTRHLTATCAGDAISGAGPRLSASGIAART